MPRFFRSIESWIKEVPVIYDGNSLRSDIESLITVEVHRIIREEMTGLSIASRVITITARYEILYKVPCLFIRFNIINNPPYQFCYRIREDGTTTTLERFKQHDRFGIDA